MADRAAADLVRQQVEKGGEISRVEWLERGELPEDRAELVAQLGEAAGEEALHVGRRPGQFVAMRQIARRLQRKDEIRRRLVAPLLEARRGLDAVERAVDLDRG